MAEQLKLIHVGDIHLRPNFYMLDAIAPSIRISDRKPNGSLTQREFGDLVGFLTQLSSKTDNHPHISEASEVKGYIGRDPVTFRIARWSTPDSVDEGQEIRLMVDIEVAGINPRRYIATKDGLEYVKLHPEASFASGTTYRDHEARDILSDLIAHLAPTPPK